LNKELQPKVVFLMGPTASGKTALALELAEKHNCEIISVDSALIYRGMDIGSAKPSAEEIISMGKTPLLVGGTMMYFKALLEGLSPLPSADEAIRADIQAEADTNGWEALHEQLREIDPVSAERIHPNDPQRLSRALEVYRISGKSLTELTMTKSAPLPYDVVQFAIAPRERKVLHALIGQRFRIMLEQGFIDEVVQLKARGDLHLDLPSMRCVGYRQCWQYLDGEFDYDTMVEKAVAATRQLAKRQLTWLRSWPELNWLESGAEGNLVTLMRQCR